MTFTAHPQFQQAVIRRLREDEDFSTLCKGGTHDALPASPSYPYAVLDQCVEVPDPTFGQNGHAISGILSIYSRDGTITRAGRGISGYDQVSGLAEAACKALFSDHEPMLVEGHDVVTFEVGDVTSGTEDDNKTRRLDIAFNASLECHDGY